MNDNIFAYYEGGLEDFIAKSLLTKDTLLKCVITMVSENLVSDLQDMGVVIDQSYRHTLDNSAIHHIIKTHGSSKEELRGQIPISDSDLLRISEIVSSYDTLAVEKNRREQDVIIYTKTMDDGITFYVEEIRRGRHELAANTMYKRKKRRLTDANRLNYANSGFVSFYNQTVAELDIIAPLCNSHLMQRKL